MVEKTSVKIQKKNAIQLISCRIASSQDSYTEYQEGEPRNLGFYENSYNDASSKFRTDSPLAKYATTQLQLE
ncbi:unnamed protein product, partial [Mesorhabditis spiculigera]